MADDVAKLPSVHAGVAPTLLTGYEVPQPDSLYRIVEPLKTGVPAACADPVGIKKPNNNNRNIYFFTFVYPP